MSLIRIRTVQMFYAMWYFYSFTESVRRFRTAVLWFGYRKSEWLFFHVVFISPPPLPSQHKDDGLARPSAYNQSRHPTPPHPFLPALAIRAWLLLLPKVASHGVWVLLSLSGIAICFFINIKHMLCCLCAIWLYNGIKTVFYILGPFYIYVAERPL